jgi:membrane protein YdbS with pleckstrin-like domain
VTRRQAFTLAAVVDLVIAFTLAVVGYVTGEVVFGVIGIVMLLGAVAILIVSRQV